MSPVSEEIKADSLGLPNLKGTVKATLEMLRRIQRQTAKAFSLVGIASITGMGIAGLLLAPFPVPTADVREVRESLPEDVEVFGTPEVVTQDHKKKLPLPPAPIVDSVGIDVYAAQWPHPGTSAELGISVGHDDLRRSNDCYYFSGPIFEPEQVPYGFCWMIEEHEPYDDWKDGFLCGATCYSLYGNNYYICKIERFGDGVAKYDDSRPSYTEVYYQEGEYYAEVYPSDGAPYKVAVTLTFHP